MTALDDPCAGTGAAAYAAQVSPEVLQSWLDRGRLRLGAHDIDTNGSGERRSLTLRRVYQIALTSVIAGIGLPVRSAAVIARRFTDEASGGRAAGELFPEGPTLIVQDASGTARVVNERPHSPAALIVEVAPILAAANDRLRARGIEVS